MKVQVKVGGPILLAFSERMGILNSATQNAHASDWSSSIVVDYTESGPSHAMFCVLLLAKLQFLP